MYLNNRLLDNCMELNQLKKIIFIIVSTYVFIRRQNPIVASAPTKLG